MANFRPAGASDEDSDSDDYGFYEKPVRKYYQIQDNPKKKLEVNLQDAIINGNFTEVQKILKYDLHGNVNTKLDSGWTPLMHACFHAQEEIVEYFLSEGADPNLHSDSVTPVMVACSNSSANADIIEGIVSSLIGKGCILNIGDKYGQSPLMRATGSGQVAVVQRLLDQRVNIEMRDQQGWTALFWAVHHNQAEILEVLIAAGARLTEVDKQGRTPTDIAYTHDYQNIVEILNSHTRSEEDDETDGSYCTTQISSWHDFYPGIKAGVVPTYTSEIPHLLYGMNCESLTSLMETNGLELRAFLLLDDGEMIKLGIELPYERQRLTLGLKHFHMRGWKLNAVAGLYARNMNNYKVLDCLTTLGTHLQQIYILEATLQYTLREYSKINDQMKFEPPDSPTISKLDGAATQMLTSIRNIKKEGRILNNLLKKISRSNPRPADLIKGKTWTETLLGCFTEVVFVCTLSLVAKALYKNLTKK